MHSLSKLPLCCLALCFFAWGQAPQDDLAAARILLRNGQNDAALVKLEEIAAQRPRTPGLNHEFGLAYYEKSDYLKAATYLERAVKENEKDLDAVQLLGLAYYRSGRPAQAIPYLEQLRSAGNNPDVAYVLAQCYALNQDYQHAQEVVARLYDVRPGTPASRLLFSRVLLLQGLDSVAELQAREALKQATGLPGAHFILGQVYLYRSDVAHAIEELKAEIEINPLHTLALTRLGDAYTRSGQLQKAQEALQRSIWLDAENAESYTLLGKVLLLEHDPARAARFLQQAIARDANDYTSHHLLSEAYQLLGQNELAAREMRIAARMEQQRPNLRLR